MTLRLQMHGFVGIERLAFTDRDVLLMASTLGHQTGYLYGYCLNLLLGATAVWMDVWNVEEAARLIEAERVTFTMGATPFLRDLTYTQAPSDLASLRVFISAGAPSTGSQFARAVQRAASRGGAAREPNPRTTAAPTVTR